MASYRHLAACSIAFALYINIVVGEEHTSQQIDYHPAFANVTFNPRQLQQLQKDEKRTVNFTFWYNSSLSEETQICDLLRVVPANPSVVRVLPNRTLCEEDVSKSTGSFTVVGLMTGQTSICLRVGDNCTSDSFLVDVATTGRTLDIVFQVISWICVCVFNIAMGCAVDLTIVKETLKKPKAPSVGFLCQYGIMPVVAYGTGLLIFGKNQPILRFALLTFGCSPGGGESNMWAIILGGNIDLSLTLTLVTTLAALGMMPLWLYTLGRTIMSDTNIAIPYLDVTITLGSTMLPLVVGILLKRFFPRVADFWNRWIIGPLSLVLVIVLLTMFLYFYWFIFTLFTWQMVVAGLTNVSAGFMTAGVLARMFGLPKKDAITISLETGIQNTGLASAMIFSSLPTDISSTAVLVPIAASLTTPVLLLGALCVRRIRDCCFRRNAFDLHDRRTQEDKSVEGISVKDTAMILP